MALALLDNICRESPSPTQRATLLVERFAAVHCVGRKLAAMFGIALSTLALAPALTPWFPEIDGNKLVDVNAPSEPRPARTVAMRTHREHRPREFRPDPPKRPPRLAPEALYALLQFKLVDRARGHVRWTGRPCVHSALSLDGFHDIGKAVAPSRRVDLLKIDSGGTE